MKNIISKYSNKIARRLIVEYQYLKDAAYNMCDRKHDLLYIVEDADWSIKWDGFYIAQAINRTNKLNAAISTTDRFLTNKIIHYGSINCFLGKDLYNQLNDRNKHVVTWFHTIPNDERLVYLKDINAKADKLHTSCKITAHKLLEAGLDESKLVIIPIGIDLNRFTPTTEMITKQAKKKLKLPKDKIVIGSFQKDGNGWGEGLTPKLIKGPDTFCDVVEQLSNKYPIHILLTGPARGYVKQRLEKANIGYTHRYLKNYWDICEFYKAIDLYIVTSRNEGGPKAITESMASGVPIISTKVGMAPEIIKDRNNGILCNIDSIDMIVDAAEEILNNKSLSDKIIKNGFETVKQFSWDKIAEQYHDKLYKNLLQSPRT